LVVAALSIRKTAGALIITLVYAHNSAQKIFQTIVLLGRF